MTQINLLPWRERKREQEKKLFLMLWAACTVLSFLMVFLVYHYASNLLKNQTIRNQMLQQEIAIYDNQIRERNNREKIRTRLISRMSIVHNLQATRTLMVHLLDELIKTTPSGIYLTQVEGKNGVISVAGYAEANTYVSQIMKNMEHNDWLHSPVLSEIKKMEDKKQAADNVFKLRFMLSAPGQME